MNTADGVIDGTSEKFSNDGSVEWKTVLMMAREDDETFEWKKNVEMLRHRNNEGCIRSLEWSNVEMIDH